MRSTRCIPRLLAVLLGGLGAFGCGGSRVLRTGGPYPEDAAPSEGVRYYAARDIVVIDTRLIKSQSAKWGQVSKGEVCTADPVITDSSVTYDLATQAVPDPKQSFRLGIMPQGRAKQTVNVSVSESGLLTGVNYTVEDKTGQIITNVLKGVAGIAGAVAGIADLREGKFDPPNAYCYELSDKGKPVRAELNRLNAQLERLLTARLDLLERSQSAKTSAELATFRGKDSLLSKAVAIVSDQVRDVRGVYDAGLKDFLSSAKITPKVDTQPARRFSFDVTQLPALSAEQIAKPHTWLPQDTRMEMFRASRLVLAVENPPAAAAGADEGTGDKTSGSLSCKMPADSLRCARIHFRLPRQRFLTVYALGKGSTPSLEARERRLTALISSADAVLNVALEGKTFGASGFKLGFGPRGNLTTLEQTSEAAAATGSAAFVDAIAQSRTEFQAGLKAVADAQGSIIGIQQAARTARIKEIADQKSLLDSQITLEGARTSKDLVLQKQQLDAELAVLIAQQTIATKSATLDNSSIQAELDALKLQIELLKAQLELEKAKRELEAAKAKPPETP